MSERADVAVVGGGLAGLRAARDLAEGGVPTILLEGRDRLGGRTYTVEYEPTGDLVELGGAYFLGEHREVRTELARYGLGERRWPLPRSFRWHTGGISREGLPVPPEQWSELERALRALAQDADDYAAGADAEVALLSLGEYLDRLGTTPEVRDFLFGWSVTSVGAPEAEGAVGDGLSSLADHGGLLGYAKILELTPVPGWRHLAEAMAATPGLELRLGQPVHRIVARGGGYRLSTQDGELDARRVVLALPINVLPSMRLDVGVPPGIAEVSGANAGAAVKVVLRARGVPDGCWGVGRGLGLSQLVWDRADGDLAWIVAFGAKEEAIDLSARGNVGRAVQAFFPDAEVLDSAWHDWNSDPFSLGTWRTARPGHRPAHGTENDPESTLQFAGSDISSEAQGWIEGALCSGAIAAANLLRQLGRRP